MGIEDKLDELKRLVVIILLLIIIVPGLIGLIYWINNDPTSNNQPSVLTLGGGQSPDQLPQTFTLFEMVKGKQGYPDFMHPDYSVEYPTVFRVGNIDGTTNTLTEEVISTKVTLMAVDEDSAVFGTIVFNVESVTSAAEAAESELNAEVSARLSETDNVTEERVMIAGQDAGYVESYWSTWRGKVNGQNAGPEYRHSKRLVVFDYAGYLWEVSMTWDYSDTEPEEVQQYFIHVVETFKILD